jgi:hypothetical protein
LLVYRAGCQITLVIELLLALRRKGADLNSREQRLTQALRELIQDGRAQLVGPVCQELLSGLREEASFKYGTNSEPLSRSLSTSLTTKKPLN